MSISGAGPVDGHEIDFSSSLWELQSQMATAIIAKHLLHANQAIDIPVLLLGDNKGIQNKYQKPCVNRLHHH